MSKKVFVGNLSYSITHESLREIFSKFGTVNTVNLITDKSTGQSKGFAIIEMSQRSETECAIQNLNAHELKGRKITVSVYKPSSNNGNNDKYNKKHWY